MIIGISGVAGSGKDTCADFLVRKHGFVKVALGDPLKRICRDVYGFTDEQLWGPSELRNAPDKRYPREHTFRGDTCACCGHGLSQCYLTPRFALQQLGTEWGRRCYWDTWLDYGLRVARKLNIEGGYSYTNVHGLSHDWRPGDDNWKTSVVISDIRFKNELDALRIHHAKLIRIVRPSAGLSGAAGQHVSETEQASMPDALFDSVIQNDRGLRELEEAITDLVRHWGDR